VSLRSLEEETYKKHTRNIPEEETYKKHTRNIPEEETYKSKYWDYAGYFQNNS